MGIVCDEVGNVFCGCRWHSAGTYDQGSKTGGPFGTMRLKAEQGHGANNGIDIAIRLVEPIKEQFPTLSYADFYQVPSPLLCDAMFEFAWLIGFCQHRLDLH